MPRARKSNFDRKQPANPGNRSRDTVVEIRVLCIKCHKQIKEGEWQIVYGPGRQIHKSCLA